MAVLRLTIGLSQQEMAKLVRCSARTIQAIELKNQGLTLSENLAARIADETGVNFQWLMDGNPEAPIVNYLGLPYSKQSYEDRRAQLSRPVSTGTEPAFILGLATLFRGTAGILLNAMKEKRAEFFFYRMKRFLEEQTKEFGFAKEIEELPGFVSNDDPDIMPIYARFKKVAQERRLAWLNALLPDLQQRYDEYEKLQKSHGVDSTVPPPQSSPRAPGLPEPEAK